MEHAAQSGKILYDWPGPGCEPELKFTDAAQLGWEPYDVAIVGAGVVGCALAFRLSRYRLKVLLADKNYDVGEGASKANSAIIHTGFDATPGSLESRLVTAASRQWPELARRLKIPLETCGALLLALSDEQGAQLPEILDKALANGVEDVNLLAPAQIKQLEAHVSDAVRGGLLVPREAIVDPFSAPIAFAEVALANGVDVLLGVEIVGVENPGASVKTLVSSAGKRIRARILVNAAGLGSRALADRYSGRAFDINPRRGQFLVFDKCSRSLLGRILLPVPTPQTKGMLVTPTIFGNLIAGPTAEDLPPDAPDATETTAEGLAAVLAGASRLMPRLKEAPVIAHYAGARCHCAQGSYLIRYNDPYPGIVTVTGVRSTGLTSSPALADFLSEGLAARCGLKLDEKPGALDARPESGWPGWWSRPFAQEQMIRSRPDYGRMVCCCENVSRGEILDALDSPLKPRTLDAVKRRTRTQTGRCQGFECQVHVAEIISRHCGIPLAQVSKSGPGSELLSAPGRAGSQQAL